MKTYFISWEIRLKAGEISYSNSVIEAGNNDNPVKIYEKALNNIADHYGVGIEKITARAFNEVGG